MIIPEPFTGKEIFWDVNSQYRYIFEEFYKADRSKNKSKSSKVMWAITLRVHPGSDFYNLSNKDELITTRFLKDEEFKFEDYDEIEDLFLDSVLSQAEKSMYRFNRTLKKRDDFIHTQDFVLDHYNEEGRLVKGTVDQLDKMLANTSKLYDDYFKIKKQLVDEEIKRGKGNKPVSISDADQI